MLVSLGATGCGAPPAEPVTAPHREDVARWAVSQIVRALPDRLLAGQLLMVGIENDADGRPLVSLDDAARVMIADVQPGAAVLFGRTFASIEQVASLVGELDSVPFVRPIVATDYEGGLVSRLTTTGGVPATPIPSAADVGRAMAALASVNGASSAAVGDERDDPLALARRLGGVMGRELRSLGVTMNFAPVADVNPPGGVGAIGRHGRAYGDDPGLVGRVAAEVVAGLQAEGVAAVVKHFPGHGAVADDSHDRLPVLDASAATLRERELAAFRIALEPGPVGLMTGHLVVPSITGPGVPASLSPAVTRLARVELGFDGLVVTDALNMRALTEIADEPELVVRALEAGADMVLKPRDPVGARDAIVAAIAGGRLSREAIERSVERVFLAKRGLGILGAGWLRVGPAEVDVESASAVLGAAAHRAVADRVRSLAGGAD